MRLLRTGDPVVITYDSRTVRGTVKLASSNGRSLVLEYEAILGGFLGIMPALMDDDGSFRDLLFGRPIVISHIDQVSDP